MEQDLTKDLQGIIPALWRVESIAAKRMLPDYSGKRGRKEKNKKYSGIPQREYIPTGK
jgi:hypothetical protein